MGMRKLFAIISVSVIALLFVALFLPYVDNGYGATTTLWDGYGDTMKTIIVLELLAGIVICGLTVGDVTKDFKFAIFAIGYSFSAYVGAFIDAIQNDWLSYYDYGFWVNLLLTIAAVAIIVVGNLIKDEPVKKEVKMNMQTNMGNNNNRYNQNMNNNYNPNMNQMPPQGGYGNPNMNGVFGNQGMSGGYPNQGMNNNMPPQGGYGNQGYNNYNNRYR